MASRASRQSARRGARVEHAGIPVAGREPRGRGRHGRQDARPEARGRAVHRRGHPRRRGRGARQDGNGSVDRLSTGPGQGLGELVTTMDINTFRGIITGVLLVLFLWLVAWAWSKA